MRGTILRRRFPASWQYQPTLSAHDPSNVLTIGADSTPVGLSCALPSTVRAAVGASVAQPSKVRATVGLSSALPSKLKAAAGLPLALPYFIPGFPATSTVDTFNRANENPATGWTTITGYNAAKVLSNRLASAAGAAAATFDAGPNSSDTEAWATVAVAGFAVEVSVRATGTNYNRYGMTLTLGTWELRRYSGAGPTIDVIATNSITISAGDQFGIRAIGNKISAWYKPVGGSWSRVAEVTDNTHASGKIAALLLTGTLEDFGGGALRSAGLPLALPSNIKSAAGASAALPSGIKSAVGLGVALPAKVKSAAGLSAALPSKVRSAVGLSLAEPSKVRAAVGASLGLPAKVRVAVGLALAEPYKLRTAVGASAALPAKARVAAGASAALPSHVLAAAGLGLALPSKVKMPAGAGVALPFRVPGSVGASLALPAGVKVSVGAGLGLPYASRSAVGATLVAPFSSRSTAGQGLVLGWRSRAATGSAAGLQWRVLAAAPAGLELRWAMRSDTGSSAALPYKSHVTAGAGLTLSWEIATSVSAGSSLRAPYRTLVTAGGGLDAGWRVLASAGLSSTQPWTVREALGSRVGFPYGLLARATTHTAFALLGGGLAGADLSGLRTAGALLADQQHAGLVPSRAGAAEADHDDEVSLLT